MAKEILGQGIVPGATLEQMAAIYPEEERVAYDAIALRARS